MSAVEPFNDQYNAEQPQIKILPDGRMRPDDASLYTGFSKQSLANWRSVGKGPRFLKRSGQVFYFKSDLDEWLLQPETCNSTGQSNLNLSHPKKE